MQIGIFSDIHRNQQNIDEALEYFLKERVDLVIGAGDVSNDVRSLSYVVQNLATARIPTIIFPGSHEQYYDWMQVMQQVPNYIINGAEHRKIPLDGFDLVLLPGSEMLAGGNFRLTNEPQVGNNNGSYIYTVNELDTLIQHPEKTIIACHNPPKFSSPNMVDIAFFGSNGEGVLPGYDALFYNRVLGETEQIQTRRDNRGYQPFTDKISALFPGRTEKIISGHFHESTHKVHDRSGRAIPENTWTRNLYHLASNLDLYRLAIWETRINNGQLEVRYKNVNLS